MFEARSAVFSLIVGGLVTAPLVAATRPADLRVLWGNDAASVQGHAGTNVELPYEVTNMGGTAAFAIVVTARTTVGSIGTPSRIQPGPQPGSAVVRKVSFALVRGMREICIDAVLQHRVGGEPPDPDLTNNRICRAISMLPEPRASEEDPR